MPTESLTTFFNDLRAAVFAGVKLEIGGSETRKPEKLTSKRIDQWEQDAEKETELPQRCRAAIDTWNKTGSMIPVLEGLSTRADALSRISGLFRKSLLYVLAIGTLAIAALVWYPLVVLPEITAVREDLMTLARPVEEIRSINAAFWANVVLAVFIIAFGILISWLLKGGVARAGWWLGANSYLRYRTLATASRILQALVAEGEEPKTAANLSSQLAGLGPEETGELLASIRDHDRTSVLSSEWSDYLLMMAQQQYVTARIWGPASMIAIVGGLFTLLYVVLAYWPITSLVFELSQTPKV